MNKYILITLLSGFTALMSCNSEKVEGTLAELKAEKDSLMENREKISERISLLNEQISLMDTSKKLLIVTTANVPVSSFDHYFEIQGNVEADKNILIYPESPGTINRIVVKEGQKVSKGALLVQLDADVIQKSIQEAETSYDLAKTVYEKQSKLWEKKIGSEMQYLEAKTNKESLEARLSSLRAQKELLTVRAPFSGIVDEVFPKEGEMAAPQMPLVRLINLDEVYIKSEVSERYINKVTEGTPVTVIIPNAEQEIQSKINLVGNYINPNNRTFKIRVDMNNDSKMMKPNLLAKVLVKDFQKDSTVVLPEKMIQQTPTGESFIYLVEHKDGQNYVRKKIIKTGLSYNNQVMVLEGLTGGEEFIQKGSRSVKEGQRVQIEG